MKKVQRPDSQQGDHQGQMFQPVDQGTLTLILKGGQVTSLSLLVRNQLFQEKLVFFFIFKTT